MAGGGGKSSGAVGFQGQLRRGGARAQVRSQGRQLSCHPPRCQLPPRVTRICWGVSGYSCTYNHCRSSRGPSQTRNETPDTTRHPVFKCDKRYKWPRRQDATGRDAVRQWPALVWQHGVERASTCGGAGLASRPPESSPTGATCTMAMVVWVMARSRRRHHMSPYRRRGPLRRPQEVARIQEGHYIAKLEGLVERVECTRLPPWPPRSTHETAHPSSHAR